MIFSNWTVIHLNAYIVLIFSLIIGTFYLTELFYFTLIPHLRESSTTVRPIIPLQVIRRICSSSEYTKSCSHHSLLLLQCWVNCFLLLHTNIEGGGTSECPNNWTSAWSLVRFSFFVHGSDKLFAKRILQSIRCHLRSFSMHPFNYDADKLKPLFISMLHVQSNQSIIILQVSECTASLMRQCTKRRSICTGVGLDTWVTVSCSWVHLGWGEIQRCMTPTPHQTTSTEVN